MKRKKSQITGDMLIKIIILVFVVIIVIFGINGYRKIRAKQEGLSAVIMKGEIEEIIGENVKVGTITNEELNLPKNMDVCFIDLDKREEILSSYQIQSFPRVKNALEGGINDNVFILKEGEIKDSTFANVCLEEYPFFLCSKFAAKPLKLSLEGKGKCASLFFNMTIIAGDNKKSPDYPESVVFFMPYQETNWRETLRLVPAVMWNEAGTLKGFPYLVFYGSSADLETQRINETLIEYSGDKAIIFSTQDAINGNIEEVVFSDSYYISFWAKFQDIVLIDYDNRDSALIAALYAAELNAPLIFVNSGNIKNYEGWIIDRKIHIIDEIDDMNELNIANQIVTLSGNYLKSHVIGDKFSRLKSQIDLD